MPNKKKLEEAAKKITKKLSLKGINSEIIEDSYREYSVNLSIDDNIITLYYSPNRKEYKLKTDKLKSLSLEERITQIFNSIFGNRNNVYKNKGYEIDVDGSYSGNVTSYAAVIRKDGKVIKEIYGTLPDNIAEGSRQIAGEITAAAKAAEYCDKYNIKEATIYYDYKGIAKWATGDWKAKKNITSRYADYMSGVKVRIKWVKLESHTGYIWNDYADKLAKKAATEKP